MHTLHVMPQWIFEYQAVLKHPFTVCVPWRYSEEGESDPLSDDTKA